MTNREPTPADAVLVAIDISKLRNDVLIERPGSVRRLLNTKTEHDRFVGLLGDFGRQVIAGFEATGNYHRPLAHRLLEAGVELRLVSSVALARTREALHNGWDKNDPKDAQVILHMLRIGATQTYCDPIRAGIHNIQELSKTHEVVSKAKTELWHRLLTMLDMFTTAQWAQASEAAASLTQMAARQAKGDNTLARLVRERQDLVVEWQTRDKTLAAARSRPPDIRIVATEVALSTRLADIDGRVGEIEGALAKDFPKYAALARPEPLSIHEVQVLLGSHEALVLILDTPESKPTPEETFIWVITKTDSRWVRNGLGTKALTERVAALRCGLDQAAWDGDGADRCSGLINGTYTVDDARGGKALPFQLTRAHEVYKALFSEIEDLIRDRHLLIVLSGPLTSLPFQVLVTDKPATAMPAEASGYANAAWLANRHAITVLPSVASLKALRRFAKASKAARPFIGFGNPLLLGPAGNDRRAWERQSCKGSPVSRQVASRGVRAAIPRFFRGGLADVDEVRAQYPLPETADELCAVAQSMGVGEEAVYLGKQASETIIKAASANGTLAQARVVHFATHGLLAGETEMLAASKAEPALLLTPPAQASEEDDGLLTASEIAQLNLDADWVVLSACNTAASSGDKPGAEALSGLARAFFYAGARALLVSHWAVNSDATVKLITKAFDELKADHKIGRAEAMRRSALALVATGGSNAHPANWAPFVVVGEGAR